MAGTHNFTCEQGADWSRTITWTIGSSLVDLAGYTARMQIRRHHSSTEYVLQLVSGVGGQITLGGVAGTIVLALTAAVTAALPDGLYVYDLELVSAAGVVTRLIEGTFTISPEVTRDTT